jgi:hypothetical protein
MSQVFSPVKVMVAAGIPHQKAIEYKNSLREVFHELLGAGFKHEVACRLVVDMVQDRINAFQNAQMGHQEAA